MTTDQISDHTAVVGGIGLGYVGLPLAVEAARSGFRVPGFDLSERVVDRVNAGRTHIQDESRAVRGARVLVLGISYKKDIDDLRESPAFGIICQLQDVGADVSYLAGLMVDGRGVMRGRASAGRVVGLSGTEHRLPSDVKHDPVPHSG